MAPIITDGKPLALSPPSLDELQGLLLQQNNGRQLLLLLAIVVPITCDLERCKFVLLIGNCDISRVSNAVLIVTVEANHFVLKLARIDQFRLRLISPESDN